MKKTPEQEKDLKAYDKIIGYKKSGEELDKYTTTGWIAHYALVNGRCAWCNKKVDKWTDKEIKLHVEAHDWSDKEHKSALKKIRQTTIEECLRVAPKNKGKTGVFTAITGLGEKFETPLETNYDLGFNKGIEEYKDNIKKLLVKK